jgi:hypothetical protein
MQDWDRNLTGYRIGPNPAPRARNGPLGGQIVQRGAHRQIQIPEYRGNFVFWARFLPQNGLFEGIVNIGRLESSLPLFRVRGVHNHAKPGLCRSASASVHGYELLRRTCRCPCSSSILSRSGTRSSRLAWRRPGWLSHPDPATHQPLVPCPFPFATNSRKYW